MEFGLKPESTQAEQLLDETTEGEPSTENLYTVEDVTAALAAFGVHHISGGHSAEAALDAHYKTLKNYSGLTAYPDEDDIKMIRKEITIYSNYSGSELGEEIATDSLAILRPIEQLIQEKIQEEKEAEEKINNIRDSL